MGPRRVTVGMPVYNDPDGVRRSIPTVLGQTWGGSVRLLAIDDGSTDDTPGVLSELAERYSGIEIVRNEENQGRPAARNKILDLAGDDYLAWLDAGDLWHPRKLEVQLAALFNAEHDRMESPLLCVGPFRWYFADRGVERIRVPEVDGDQLYSALTGKLFPYLQAIVGPAESFRRIGGFDERLKRRQDYDFLVRFIGEGGRVIRSQEDVSVFTYLKSDVGSSAKDVAEANRVLRRKHQPYYDKYGYHLARYIRYNQHRLAARFYRHNGERARSMGYEALARFTSPSTAWRRTSRRFRSPRRLATYAGRLPMKALRPALPLLQRPQVLDIARKLGVFNIASGTPLTRHLLVDLKSEIANGAGFSVLPKTRHGERPPEAEQIEQEVRATESSVPLETWLRLEYIYRQHSLLHSAESALRRGLGQHPEGAELRVRLIELLALRRKWSECAELWRASRNSLHTRDLRGLTYARVARSLREVGDVELAEKVAKAGAESWPDDLRVRDEFYTCRAARLDWKQAVLPGASVSDQSASGLVTDLGFLIGSSGPLTGLVAASGPEAVSLVVNGDPIASTHAVRQRPDDEWARFSLNCQELLNYLGNGDVLWVECSGERLVIEENCSTATIQTGYPSRMRELKQEMANGYVFTKFGQLRMGNTFERRKHTLALFDQVSALIADSHGYHTYPFYGHLLGAIREHGFIAHDAGGFDMGYLSEHSNPEEVRSEFIEILRMLIFSGYHLRVEPWSAYVRPTSTSHVFVDLNYAWFSSSGELRLSFGWRYRPLTDKDWFKMPRESLIGNRLIRVPGNAEAVLEQIYGSAWAVPDQGFVVNAEIQRDERSILTIEDMQSIELLDPDRVVAICDHHPDWANLRKGD